MSVDKTVLKYEVDTVLTPPGKPTTVRNDVVNEMGKKRYEFNLALKERGYWPQAPFPGDCWIFEEVLGIDPETVVAHGVTPTSYKAFIINHMTHDRAVDKGGNFQKVTRKFDSKQKKALKEWWPLLSEQVRGEYDEWTIVQKTQ